MIFTLFSLYPQCSVPISSSRLRMLVRQLHAMCLTKVNLLGLKNPTRSDILLSVRIDVVSGFWPPNLVKMWYPLPFSSLTHALLRSTTRIHELIQLRTLFNTTVRQLLTTSTSLLPRYALMSVFDLATLSTIGKPTVLSKQSLQKCMVTKPSPLPSF